MPQLHATTVDEFPTGPPADAWDDLVDRDPSATIFHSARFLRLWCRYLRGKCDLKLRIVSRDDGTPVGVVPEVRERAGDAATARPTAETDPPAGDVLIGHFAGGYHVTDYLGPVSRPRDRAAVVDAWLDALDGEDDWDTFLAAGLPEDAGWHDLVAGGAAALGFDVTGPEVEDVCPRIDLTGGWDAYLDRITGKQRHEIRRKARKLAREGGTVKLVDVDSGDLPGEIERFIALARTSPGEKRRFFADDDKTRFFTRLARELDDGTLRVHRLDLDGRPAAITVSLVHGEGDRREWGLYNSAFDRDFGHLAPGMVLVGELIRIASEEGCAVFDLLRGDEPYKYRFGAVDRRLMKVRFSRSG